MYQPFDAVACSAFEMVKCKTATYRHMMEGGKKAYQIEFDSSIGQVEGRRRAYVVWMAIQIRAPSARLLEMNGNDFQCSIPPYCRIVTQQDFDFPVKILRLLPDVCDELEETLWYCKQLGEKTTSPEEPAFWGRAGRVVLYALIALAVLGLCYYTILFVVRAEMAVSQVQQIEAAAAVAPPEVPPSIMAEVLARNLALVYGER